MYLYFFTKTSTNWKFLCYNECENLGEIMLKLILDTNLFRHRELQGLEDYTLSSLFEKINILIANANKTIKQKDNSVEKSL